MHGGRRLLQQAEAQRSSPTATVRLIFVSLQLLVCHEKGKQTETRSKVNVQQRERSSWIHFSVFSVIVVLWLFVFLALRNSLQRKAQLKANIHPLLFYYWKHCPLSKFYFISPWRQMSHLSSLSWSTQKLCHFQLSENEPVEQYLFSLWFKPH